MWELSLFNHVKGKAMKKIVMFFAVILSVALTAGLTYGLTYNRYKREIEFCRKNADLLTAYEDIKNNFYKIIDDETLCEYMIKGVLDACDEEYSTFETSNMFDESRVNGDSSVSRSGFTVDKNRHDEIVVTEVKQGSRADEMGLMTNDIIMMINDETIAEKGGYYKAIRKLMGKDNTTMKLHIRRGTEELDIDFRRCNIVDDSEKNFYSEIMGNDILYIHFLHFDQNSVISFEEALNENEFKSIILDLRNNHGGEVHCAAEIFDFFSEAGSKVLLKHERSGEEEIYSTSTDGNELDCGVAVLVNENTISSGEILAAFFKDTGRGILIGEQTYGKGIFQVQNMLESMLTYSYTAGYVYVNDMPNYDEVGMCPDIEVSMDESKILTQDDIQLKKAIEILS